MPKTLGHHTYSRVVLFVLYALLLGAAADTHASLLGGDLEFGPHAVGFRTMERYDYARVYRDKQDYLGTPAEGERARPMQICVWYPARAGGDLASMVYGEYLVPYTEDDELLEYLNALHSRELRGFFYLFRGNEAQVMNVMNRSVRAIRDAPPQAGAFPLIVYVPNFGRGICENAILAEYLASHGFIVASTHSLGTSSIRVSAGSRDLETHVRDQEFLLACLREYPHRDPSRLGALGVGYGGLAALLLQMRNDDVEAVGSLGGPLVDSQRRDLVLQNPYFDITQADVPLLQAYRLERQGLDPSLLDSLKYAPRCLLGFRGLPREAFTTYGEAAIAAAVEANPDSIIPRHGYDAVCRAAVDFFNVTLRENGSHPRMAAGPPPADWPADFMTVRTLPGDELPPTEDEFITIVRANGASAGVEVFRKFRSLDPDHAMAREGTLNALGYEFLQRRAVADAIELLAMATELYPHSANSWDSLAEACLAAGEDERAIAASRQVLEVLPDDPAPNDELRTILRTNAEERLHAAPPASGEEASH